jgi:hypothetical protein
VKTPAPRAAVSKGYGLIALGCYATHAAVHLHRGEPYDLLWGCHLAVVLVGAGLLWTMPALNAVGLLWSCFGLPIWLIDAFTGGEFMPSATLTHVGALVIGIAGVRLLGCPRGVWWKALTAYVALWAITRAVTPPQANVNLAFAVWPGWEDRFPSYPIYFATLFASGAATCLAGELVFRRVPRAQAVAA